MVGFTEKLNVQNCGNSTGNYVRYMYVMTGFCRKIECPELHKFYGKFSTLYVRNVWIWKKIDCHSNANSVGNCVHFTYGMSEFVKNWLSKLRKVDGKLCTLYMYGMSGFAEEIEYSELQKFIGKLYTLYM